MLLNDLCLRLNDKFELKNFPPDTPFGQLMPDVYSKTKINLNEYLESDFLDKFNGLMINGGDRIDKVYLGVFFSNELLEKIFSLNARNSMIFLHHPLDLESSGRGFLPIKKEYFDTLLKNNLSVYSLHTPLDVNREISTTRSISNAIGLHDTVEYCPNSIGFSGICGNLEKPIDFFDFIDKLKNIFDLEKINFIKKNDKVQKIGVIAGGGTSVSYIKEAISLDCDTYVSGDYVNKINNEYGRQQKKEFDNAVDNLQINLIECSHYATEELVLRKEMMDFIKKLNLPVELIKHENPWR